MFDVFLISGCILILFFCATGLLINKMEELFDEENADSKEVMLNWVTLFCSTVIFAWVLTIILRVYEYI